MSDSVLITLITGLGTLIGIGLTGYVNIRLGKIHKQLNSRMDELLAAAKSAGNAEGRKELKKEQEHDKKRCKSLQPKHLSWFLHRRVESNIVNFLIFVYSF